MLEAIETDSRRHKVNAGPYHLPSAFEPGESARDWASECEVSLARETSQDKRPGNFEHHTIADATILNFCGCRSSKV